MEVGLCQGGSSSGQEGPVDGVKVGGGVKRRDRTGRRAREKGRRQFVRFRVSSRRGVRRTRQRVLVLENFAQVQDPKIRRCWRPFVLPLYRCHKRQDVSICDKTRGAGNREKPRREQGARRMEGEGEEGGQRDGGARTCRFCASEPAAAQAQFTPGGAAVRWGLRRWEMGPSQMRRVWHGSKARRF